MRDTEGMHILSLPLQERRRGALRFLPALWVPRVEADKEKSEEVVLKRRFRGKRLFDGEWVYGYLWKDEELADAFIKDGRTLKDTHVDPETIGQLVFCNDDVEIYEGDYILDEDDEIWLVEYDEDSLAFRTVSQGLDANTDSEWLTYTNIIVIGNRWDDKLEDFIEEVSND